VKKLILLFIILLFGCSANAQYLPEIEGYNLYFVRLSEGQTLPQPQMTIKSDTTITIAWENGDSTTTPYISPYVHAQTIVRWVDNTPGLWTGDTTDSSQPVEFANGIYELTCTAVDTLQYQTGHSQPYFFKVESMLAEIPINIHIK
jgi:hypothetical protein